MFSGKIKGSVLEQCLCKHADFGTLFLTSNRIKDWCEQLRLGKMKVVEGTSAPVKF